MHRTYWPAPFISGVGIIPGYRSRSHLSSAILAVYCGLLTFQGRYLFMLPFISGPQKDSFYLCHA